MPAPLVPRIVLETASKIARTLPTSQAEKLALQLAEATSATDAHDWVPGMAATANGRTAAERVIDAWRECPALPGSLVGACVAAAAHAHEDARKSPTTELVVSGPKTAHLNPRLTEQVLLTLIAEARECVLLVTYALHVYPELRSALKSARARGVAVTVLAEDPIDKPQFNGNPRSALTGLDALRLRWPADKREVPGASLHAKLVIVDRRKALVTSANLTQFASNANLEAGLLVTGGSLPERLAQYVQDLREAGTLIPA